MKYDITVYPHAVLDGTIDVPDDISGTYEVGRYVEEHWGEIDFADPEIDCEGAVYDITKVND